MSGLIVIDVSRIDHEIGGFIHKVVDWIGDEIVLGVYVGHIGVKTPEAISQPGRDVVIRIDVSMFWQDIDQIAADVVVGKELIILLFDTISIVSISGPDKEFVGRSQFQSDAIAVRRLEEVGDIVFQVVFHGDISGIFQSHAIIPGTFIVEREESDSGHGV